MPARAGQRLLGTYVDADLAERFAAVARETDGGTSAALRRLIYQAVEGRDPPPPRGRGVGRQVSVRLKPEERALLDAVARERGTSAASWLRSLAIVHLARRPQWAPAELDALRLVFGELRRIGTNLNQIARALNVAVTTGEYVPQQGDAAREAADQVRAETERVGGLVAAHNRYWGVQLREEAWRDPPEPKVQRRHLAGTFPSDGRDRHA